MFSKTRYWQGAPELGGRLLLIEPKPDFPLERLHSAPQQSLRPVRVETEHANLEPRAIHEHTQFLSLELQPDVGKLPRPIFVEILDKPLFGVFPCTLQVEDVTDLRPNPVRAHDHQRR